MNKEQFEKLQSDLHDHHIKGLGNAYTAAPIYLARVKKIDWGYEEEFAEHHCLYHDCEEYYSMEEIVDSWELDDPEELDYFLKDVPDYAKDLFKKDYRSWGISELFHFMECHMLNHEFQYLHGNERWEIVNLFLTYEEAEKFVVDKGGDSKVNIYVDSLCRSYQFRELLESIAKGKLEWKG